MANLYLTDVGVGQWFRLDDKYCSWTYLCLSICDNGDLFVQKYYDGLYMYSSRITIEDLRPIVFIEGGLNG